ncbi:MAG: glycosyltransferase family 2 protein [Myxococcota bacterium]
MPAYNYGHFIEQAVRSAFAQDYRPLELVVIDDGSTDNTWEVLGKLERQAPIPMRRLKGEHKGVSAAMNLGLRNASGEWIAMLHADDWAREDRISKQVAAIAPGVVLVHSEYVSVDPEGRRTSYDSSLDLPPVAGDALRKLLLLQGDVRSMTLMFKREALAQAGAYDDTLPVEDWQSILRLAKLGLVAHVPEQLVFRRVHPTSVSFTSHRKKKTFSMREIGIDVIREVCPPDLPFERVCVLHAAVVLRNAIAMGAWEKVADGLQQCWAMFPGERRLLIASVTPGLASYVWVNGLRPRAPEWLLHLVLKFKAQVLRARYR